MRYKNYTDEAVYELERQRTMNYGNDFTNTPCCENGCFSSVLYNADGHIICEECLIENVRNTFMDMLNAEENAGFAAQVIKDIIYDFSDSEILTYIENRYDKI